MPTPFVILTGASGAGKTSVACWIEERRPEILVLQGDRIGLPSDDVMAGYGPTDEPGGPTQRGFALYWLERIAEELRSGKPVLLETQCRIAFLQEAVRLHRIANARILLLECSKESRAARLQQRGQPELANAQMSDWSRFLRDEAEQFGCEILETSRASVPDTAAHVLRSFREI